MLRGTRIDKATGAVIRLRRADAPTHLQKRGRGRALVKGRVGTELRKRIDKLLSINAIVSSCGCQTLADEMDRWGVAGCEQRRAMIVAHLVANRDILTQALRANGRWAAAMMASIVPDAALRLGAEQLLTEAIEAARANHMAVRQHRGSGKPHFAGPFVPDPSWTSEIRHLTFHVFPTKRHDGWKWNLEQLARRIALFNGQMILGIVIDSSTHTADDVVRAAEAAGISFSSVIVKQNNKQLREVVTWLPMLEVLRPEYAGPNEVVFSAHAKGVRHDDPFAEGSTLLRWTETMYRGCLDDWPAVESQLNRAVATGCFRRFNNFKTPGNHQWHYSGTFVWWRLAEIGRRNWRKVDQKFFGTESWIGHQCHESETGCLFLDECGDLYQPQYWRDVVQPAWESRTK